MSDANSKYILDKITQINDKSVYCVDQAYLDAIPAKMETYNPGDRDPAKVRLDIDCEFVDDILKKSGDPAILPESNIYLHDFRFKKEPEGVIWCCDNKVVHNDEWYLSPGKKHKDYLKSYQNGTIHYFVFWRFIERPTKALGLGDQPKFEVLSVIPAGQLLMKMCDPNNVAKKSGNYKIKVI